MLSIKAKEAAPSVEPSADFSEEWPEDVVEEPALDLPELSKKKATTMKIIVWVCLLNGIAWVWCSYILAWMGKEQLPIVCLRWRLPRSSAWCWCTPSSLPSRT